MRRFGMYGLVSRALAMLFMVAFAGIAVLWSFASEHPVLAPFVIPLIVWRVVVAERKDQRLKREALAARLRDEHVPSMSPREYDQFAPDNSSAPAARCCTADAPATKGATCSPNFVASAPWCNASYSARAAGMMPCSR